MGKLYHFLMFVMVGIMFGIMVMGAIKTGTLANNVSDITGGNLGAKISGMAEAAREKLESKDAN